MPEGWLKRQLRIQADGQSGHLPEFWESLGPNSGWRGGTGESWERGPYYLDGFLPLAYLLGDDKMKKQAQEWIDWALESQDAFGHFGPKGGRVDWWPFAIILKVLTQYWDVSHDERVITLMRRFFRYMKNELPAIHLHSWAIVRWADMALSILWLYNRTGDSELLELAEMVRAQGYDWSWHFHDFGHTEKQTHRFGMRTHVVNNAMGVKAPGVQWELTGWPEHREGVAAALEMLDTYHGTATGLFTGDEHYAGKNPTQGTELCAVVEYMFSLENLISIFGESTWDKLPDRMLFGDRLERIAYNSLPGTFDETMWAHQYDQQANQVLCTLHPREWAYNGPDSNLFGLEPNYGCCTANFHQGWPKLVAHLWMATPDDGLVAVAYGPSTVSARVRGGQTVTLIEETDYPFDETIRIRVSASQEVEFPLLLRIPRWTNEARLSVNGQDAAIGSGPYARLERKWSDGDVIELALPMAIEVERRYRDSVTLKRGPLVYSLKIGERWERVSGVDECPDYAVYPTTPWNYGLAIDPENPDVEVVKRSVGDVVFGPDKAPVELRVKGRRLPEWELVNEQAGLLPQSPVSSEEPLEELTLIPYGCAKLRVTEFPLLDK
ncbi:MAG: glycoside hydrolase family 127 protein [Armatimonadetes bacterium]|nr:glycoside hydrolase family 127 protein [Armatimonadota bacterium]